MVLLYAACYVSQILISDCLAHLFSFFNSLLVSVDSHPSTQVEINVNVRYISHASVAVGT